MSEDKLKALVKEMADVRAQLDRLSLEKTELEKRYDRLRLGEIPELMDDMGVPNITYEGIGRVALTADVYASIPAPNREAAYAWLRDHNHGGVIKDTVNAGTLKALMKVLMKRGTIIPGDIFKVTPFSRASITKV